MNDMPPYRVIITGSRTTTPDDDRFIVRTVRRITDFWACQGRPVILVDGDCPYGGADLACHQYAQQFPYVTREAHPAHWHRDGAKAGPLRNQRMVDKGADICLAFPRPDSKGTWDCIRRAADAGIPVHIHPLTTKDPA